MLSSSHKALFTGKIIMLGRPAETVMPCCKTASDENAPDMRVTLFQACADLLETLSALATHHAVLDNDLQPTTDDAISSALGAVRIARRTCDDLATAIMHVAPKTSTEKELRSEALTAYFALSDGDELMLSVLIDTAPSRPLWKASTWKVWLKPDQGSSATTLNRDRSIPNHRCHPQ